MVLCDYLPGSLCLFAWYFVNICLVLDNAHWTALTIFVMLLYFCICLQRKSSPLTTAGISTAIQQTMVHRGWASSRFPGTWGGSRILWRRSRILWGGSRILWRLARISAVGGTSGGRRNLFNSCRRDSPWTLRRISFEKDLFLFLEIHLTFPTRPIVDCLLLIELFITTTCGAVRSRSKEFEVQPHW